MATPYTPEGASINVLIPPSLYLVHGKKNWSVASKRLFACTNGSGPIRFLRERS